MKILASVILAVALWGCSDNFPNTPVEKIKAETEKLIQETAKLTQENRKAEWQYKSERLKVMAELCKESLEKTEKGRGGSCHID